MTSSTKPYAYNSPTHEDYKLIVCCRFAFAFLVGYFTWAWCNASLAYLLHFLGMEQAESVFLAVILSVTFACVWVLSVFCIQSIIKLSVICLSFFAFFAVCNFFILP